MSIDKKTLELEMKDTEDLLAEMDAKSEAFNAKVAAVHPTWVAPGEMVTPDVGDHEVPDDMQRDEPGSFGPDGVAAPEKPVKKLETTCLSDVTISKVDWLWEGRIPRGMITLVEGDPGVGKSTLLADIVARHTTGTPFPGGGLARTPERALWLTLEDSLEHTLKPRIMAAGGDPSMIDACLGVPLLAKAGEPHAENIESLRDAIRRTGATLMVIDPGAATVEDANSEAIVRQAMGELFKMGQLQGITVIWIRHLVKNREGRTAMMAGGGSIGLAAAARSMLQVVLDRARKEAGNGLDRCVIQPKSNLGKEAAPFYFGLEDTLVEENFVEVHVAKCLWAYEEEQGVDHYDILESVARATTQEKQVSKKKAWEEAIYKAFERNDWQLTSGQIASELSAAGKTAQRLVDLGSSGRDFRKQHGIEWDSVLNVHRMTKPNAEDE